MYVCLVPFLPTSFLRVTCDRQCQAKFVGGGGGGGADYLLVLLELLLPSLYSVFGQEEKERRKYNLPIPFLLCHRLPLTHGYSPPVPNCGLTLAIPLHWHTPYGQLMHTLPFSIRAPSSNKLWLLKLAKLEEKENSWGQSAILIESTTQLWTVKRDCQGPFFWQTLSNWVVWVCAGPLDMILWIVLELLELL